MTRAVGDARVVPNDRRATPPPRKRIVFAGLTIFLAFGVCLIGLLIVDVYLHRRVQYQAGVNVWGYRGAVIGWKAPGETRIVALGGSTAFGYGLPWNESFPFYLEQALAGRAEGGRRYRVINLGAPGQGAFGFRFDLADYSYLRYSVAILYEGYKDLGVGDVPEGVTPRESVNVFLWRRSSPIFRMTGYLPVLPLVFREKAMAIRAGGDLDGAYRGRATFRPGLAARATAATLQRAARVADAVGTQLGKLTLDSEVVASRDHAVDTVSWRPYTNGVLEAVVFARRAGAKVVVVSQPYASDSHIAQQQALTRALAPVLAADPDVQYVNLGSIIDLRDRAIAYDGLHLVAKGNARIAAHLVEPVLTLATR